MTNQPLKHAKDSDDARQTATALRGLVERIEQFLLGQLDKLEATVERYDHLFSGHVPSAGAAEVGSDPRDGDDESQLIEKFRMDAACLADAWDRLEAAQRELRIQQQSLQITGGDAAAAPRAAGERAESAPRGNSRVLVTSAAQQSGSGRAGFGSDYTSQPLASQFRQLHLEIQKHTRRERR